MCEISFIKYYYFEFLFSLIFGNTNLTNIKNNSNEPNAAPKVANKLPLHNPSTRYPTKQQDAVAKQYGI